MPNPLDLADAMSEHNYPVVAPPSALSTQELERLMVQESRDLITLQATHDTAKEDLRSAKHWLDYCKQRILSINKELTKR